MSIPPNGLKIGMWVSMVLDMPVVITFGRSDTFLWSPEDRCPDPVVTGLDPSG